jgi:aromatic ring-opening dioxygenase LigB subunit
MSIIFSAILPHNPILVPNIGKTNQSLFTTTLASAQVIATDLKEKAPDIIIVITPSGARRKNGFVCNTAPRFTSDLSAFGDLVTRWEFSGSLVLPARLREALEAHELIHLTSNSELDYASAIALSLAEITEATPILPLSISSQSLADHYSFGQQLQHSLLKDEKKIAILASADFSHRLSKNAPAGYLAKAKKIDKKIIDLLLADKTKDFLALSSETLKEAAIEDMGTIALLLGIIKGFNWPPRLLSYESPLGVGHAVIGYNLSL